MTTIIVPSVVYTKITAEAFWDRFKNAELVDLDIASQYRPLDSNALQKAAAKRRIYRIDVQEKGFTKLTSNKTTSFIADLVTDLLLTQPRADEILLTPIDASEAYAA